MDKLDQMDPRQLLLKRGARMLAKACGGDEAAGSVVSRSDETVRRWGDPNFPETMPIFCAVQLEAECGMPILTRLMAQMAKQALVPEEGLPAPETLRNANDDMMLAVLDLSREVIEAKRDGMITPNEQAKIQRKGIAASERIGDVLDAAGTGPAVPPGVTPLRKAGS